VHSHNTHLYALLTMCKERGVKDVYIHCFLDGRDVPPTSGIEFVKELEAKIQEIGVGKIATVMGRYWAMDRNNLWDRVQKAYDAMVLGRGQATAETGTAAVEQSYAIDEVDEFVKPTVILEGGKPVKTIEEGDSIIFFNFRPDRARQLTRTFIQPDFQGFPRGRGYFPVRFVSMTQYDETFTGIEIVNPPESLTNTMGEYLSGLGKTQLRIAETQKYAHVTFFFNGGVEKPNQGEDRELIPSSKVATFDMKPDMSAYEVTEKAVALIDSGKYDVMILNFANCDMVGHTGVMKAAMEAVKAVDECVGTVVSAILRNDGRVFVTADHGNADQMIDPETGEVFTAHTTNPVPFIAVGADMVGKTLRAGGRLADIAPTMLESMGIPVPKEMTGKTLIAG
jgi:2,3-bisphosphoglycerate-independent phosphoglycerate mutase